jgi:hypothetical protein
MLTNRSNPIKVTIDTKYSNMYRLEWKDGVLSEDMYNLSRANDILRNYKEYRANMFKTPPRGARKVTGAFKSQKATRVAEEKITNVRGS